MTPDERLKLLEAAALIASVRNGLVDRRIQLDLDILERAINGLAVALDNDRERRDLEETK